MRCDAMRHGHRTGRCDGDDELTRDKTKVPMLIVCPEPSASQRPSNQPALLLSDH